jgi:hypothetical protein
MGVTSLGVAGPGPDVADLVDPGAVGNPGALAVPDDAVSGELTVAADPDRAEPVSATQPPSVAPPRRRAATADAARRRVAGRRRGPVIQL